SFSIMNTALIPVKKTENRMGLEREGKFGTFQAAFDSRPEEKKNLTARRRKRIRDDGACHRKMRVCAGGQGFHGKDFFWKRRREINSSKKSCNKFYMLITNKFIYGVYLGVAVCEVIKKRASDSGPNFLSEGIFEPGDKIASGLRNHSRQEGGVIPDFLVQQIIAPHKNLVTIITQHINTHGCIQHVVTGSSGFIRSDVILRIHVIILQFQPHAVSIHIQATTNAGCRNTGQIATLDKLSPDIITKQCRCQGLIELPGHLALYTGELSILLRVLDQTKIFVLIQRPCIDVIVHLIAKRIHAVGQSAAVFTQ